MIFEADAVAAKILVELQPWDAVTTRRLIGRIEDPDADGFFQPIGGIQPAAAHVVFVDLDAYWPGFAAGALSFAAVAITDDPVDQRDDSFVSPGADIDAIGCGPITRPDCPR